MMMLVLKFVCWPERVWERGTVEKDFSWLGCGVGGGGGTSFLCKQQNCGCLLLIHKLHTKMVGRRVGSVRARW